MVSNVFAYLFGYAIVFVLTRKRVSKEFPDDGPDLFPVVFLLLAFRSSEKLGLFSHFIFMIFLVKILTSGDHQQTCSKGMSTLVEIDVSLMCNSSPQDMVAKLFYCGKSALLMIQLPDRPGHLMVANHIELFHHLQVAR